MSEDRFPDSEMNPQQLALFAQMLTNCTFNAQVQVSSFLRSVGIPAHEAWAKAVANLAFHAIAGMRHVAPVTTEPYLHEVAFVPIAQGMEPAALQAVLAARALTHSDYLTEATASLARWDAEQLARAQIEQAMRERAERGGLNG